MAHPDLKIKEYAHWSLFLNQDQGYLGRMCLVAKREDAVDFFEMTLDEREELFRAGTQIKAALEQLFQPDLMNYASLGNVYHHLHVHFIPRYRSSRSFAGNEFTDPRWGSPYDPRPAETGLGGATLDRIRTAIQAALASQAAAGSLPQG